MKLHTFLRHTSNSVNRKQRPTWFSYEACFLNLLKTYDFENDTLTIIFDGDSTDSYAEKYKEQFPYELININVRSQVHSFFEMCKIIVNSNFINQNDLVYLVENDYLHKSGWNGVLKNLYQTYENVAYATLYDHPDKYFLSMYADLQSSIFVVNDTCHWRTTPSTTGTFCVPYEIFKMDYDIHSTNESDHYKFIGPLRDRGRTVLSSIPGYSTHCEDQYISPLVDWGSISNEYA